MTQRDSDPFRQPRGGARAFEAGAQHKASLIAAETADIQRAGGPVRAPSTLTSRQPWLALGAALIAGYVLGSRREQFDAEAAARSRAYYYPAGHAPSPRAYQSITRTVPSAPRPSNPAMERINQQAFNQASDEFGLIRQALLSAISSGVTSTIKETFKGSLLGPSQDVLPPPGRQAQPAFTQQPKPTQPFTPATPAQASVEPPASDNIDHYEVKGSFASGLAEKDLVEGSNVREGSFATGLGNPETGSVAEPDPQTMDVVDHPEVKGSFATGQAEKDLVEGGNVREGNFATPNSGEQQLTDEDWLRRKLTQEER